MTLRICRAQIGQDIEGYTGRTYRPSGRRPRTVGRMDGLCSALGTVVDGHPLLAQLSMLEWLPIVGYYNGRLGERTLSQLQQHSRASSVYGCGQQPRIMQLFCLLLPFRLRIRDMLGSMGCKARGSCTGLTCADTSTTARRQCCHSEPAFSFSYDMAGSRYT